ncbi:hypothetical protein [uncultured Methylobacterium sp.]|uniref:hypothetical protein n=1 Tax=uncultured Methylobacterium sp. TaxID=157278 RepID=UPI0035CB1C89
MRCRSHRSLLLGLAAGCVASASPSASAQEPLFLRIRPAGAPLGALVPEIGGSGRSEAEIARAAREAVWERSAVRARLAIASVCTGCLGPAPPHPPVRPPAPMPANPPDGAQIALVPPEPSPAGPQTPQPSTRGDP